MAKCTAEGCGKDAEEDSVSQLCSEHMGQSAKQKGQKAREVLKSWQQERKGAAE